MELKIEIDDIETVQCPSCQGEAIVHWSGEEYPCLVCNGNGEIQLKPELAFH